MNENNYSVYMHTNTLNGKVYIGLTGTPPEKRWNSGRGYRGSSHFNYAISKYGWNSFSHEIVKSGLSKSEAAELEKELISKYDSTNPNNGYNISIGGEIGALGVKQSEADREKRRASVRKAWSDKDLRDAQSRRLKGIKKSKETRDKMRKASLGKVISKEQRNSISETLKRKNREDPNLQKKNIEFHSKPVMCVETGIIYDSAKIAAKYEMISSSMIGKCCRGEAKTAGGKHFTFISKQANTEVNTDSKESVSP